MHKYSDKFGIYMLQLNQIGNPEDEKNMPEIYYWAKLFKATTWEEIRMLAKKNEAIHQSLVTIQELTADEKAKMKMEARERYRRDMAARFELGKQESEKMIQKLQAEKEQIEAEKNQIQAEKNQIQNEKEQLKVETAKNFFQNGVSIEIVQKSIPDLTPEEIQKIYEEVMNEKNETL